MSHYEELHRDISDHWGYASKSYSLALDNRKSNYNNPIECQHYFILKSGTEKNEVIYIL